MTLLRSAIFNLWFFGTTFVLGLLGVGVRRLMPARSLDFARFWARAVLAGARVICGITVDVQGLERIPPGAALIASQHQSAFDTLIWMRLLPRPSYIYKAELARIPLFGPMLVASGQIPVDRGGSIAAIRGLLRGADRAKNNGRQIVIFPEGTRVEVGEDAEIRAGFAAIAMRIKLPIIPVATDSGRLWGRRAFRKRSGCVHIRIGEAIPPNLPQAVLVRTLRQRWRESELEPRAVDNSVDHSDRNPVGLA
ncbi:MAG: lysophospholipid acyltransferase family protein [Acetobacteraceae bacterium]